MKLAITGGTGFVGQHLIEAALGAGHSVLALTRRPQPAREGLTWIDGSLSDPASLERLIDETDAVIHAAGVLKARDMTGFELGNVTGTLAVLAAATAGGTTRFVHVSSLAARQPQLSLYGASKAKAEELVEESGLDWVIVRPPAVYGSGDRETLDLFKMARGGRIYMPPAGRLSLIHVDDLARLLLALAEPGAPAKVVLEPDDGRPNGWSHREFGDALSRAVGVPARTVSTPRFLLAIGSRLDVLLRRERAKLTPDRVAYFCHPDWVVSTQHGVPDRLWHPRIETGQGLAATAAWYRDQGWL
ncbi:NAD-dependent epimerase/dehydratase family protein [Sphingomonas sp. URHD0057]|uniref:NAD-dependent epimerase/dehydratase family protein n=1 Tax=Sphingomonas sp. URHD0057 TaxID=1380389 RepID=UPI000A9D6275|nr:NAD(P)-dependent oxidoreductase [Sphingomonas sp. URHD0057]